MYGLRTAGYVLQGLSVIGVPIVIAVYRTNVLKLQYLGVSAQEDFGTVVMIIFGGFLGFTLGAAIRAFAQIIDDIHAQRVALERLVQRRAQKQQKQTTSTASKSDWDIKL